MIRMDVSALREGLSDALNRAGFGGERIVLERRGKAVAALVPLRDLERLEGVPTSDVPMERGRAGDPAS